MRAILSIGILGLIACRTAIYFTCPRCRREDPRVTRAYRNWIGR